MAVVKPKWVKYRSMGGPRYLGKREGGKFVHVYDPPEPWGVWTQILGVVARSEGRFDTVVMYDETGVTAGPFQWTFKSGRLQKMLEFFKTIPYYDFETGVEANLFAEHCIKDGRQIFERFGFKIVGGRFSVPSSGKALNPSFKKQRDIIVDICMGRRGFVGTPKQERAQALALCALFAELGQQPDVQAAMVEYAKLEFKKALDVRRPPLKSVGGTIRCLLPDGVWGIPVPAIFFNLYQNSPGGAFKLFKGAMSEARRKGLLTLDATSGGSGYQMKGDDADKLLDIVWRRLNRSAYADWGFRSKQYLESDGKNPPRIKNIKPAIEEFYGLKLPYIY